MKFGVGMIFDHKGYFIGMLCRQKKKKMLILIEKQLLEKIRNTVMNGKSLVKDLRAKTGMIV